MKTTKAVDRARTSKKHPPVTKLTLLKPPAKEFDVTIPELKVYGKEDLVRMITGVSNPARHWTDIGQNDPVKINKNDMYRLHSVISTYRTSRVQYHRGAFDYYKQSLDEIDEAVMNGNFEAFKEGCCSLIRDMGWD